MSERLHAVVAGAGIGGLSAALALARAGLRVTVLERAPVLEEAGAGLQLAPNATGVLGEIGVLPRVMKRAMVPEAVRISSARSGEVISRLPLGPIADFRWGAPYVVIHRADLQAALHEACVAQDDVSIETGVAVAGFAVANDKVEIGAKRGEENLRLHADLLVGADGLRSIIRERIGLGLSDSPVWSGRTAYRALLPGAQAPAVARRLETNLWLGSRAHLVHYPLRDGEIINIVAIIEGDFRAEADDDLWSISGAVRDVRPRFARWHKDPRDLVNAVTDWRRWPLFDRNPVRRWSMERVILLGDAAHPMLPFLAQGAAQAIEDAGALGRAFARGDGDVLAALRTYEDDRTSRAGSVVIASRRQGAIYHLGGPAAFARDMVMRNLGAHRIMSRLDWLYTYKAPA